MTWFTIEELKEKLGIKTKERKGGAFLGGATMFPKKTT